MIRTAIVVVFFSSIRFEPATEKASRVWGAVVLARDDEVDRVRYEGEPGGGRLDDGARGRGRRRPRVTVPSREAGGAERRGRLGQRLAGEQRHGAERGGLPLMLPAASFCASVKLRSRRA